MQDTKRGTLWIGPLLAVSLAAGCQVSPGLVQETSSTGMAPSGSAYRIAAKGAQRYVVTFALEKIPSDFAATVAGAGGTLLHCLDGMGVALVVSDQASFASRLAKVGGVESVEASTRQGLVQKAYAAGFDPSVEAPDPTGASGEPLSGYQWGLDSIHAPEAWDRGYTGRGVRVAVLDTGVDDQNPDLAPNLDRRRSTSFVGEEPTFVDYNGHGSHVAGIIAAARNGYGVTGVAPAASIIAVKVMGADGWGDDFGILQGIKYAADQGAQVINMSLTSLGEDRPTIKAYRHAARYAKKKGSIIVAAVGNGGMSGKDIDPALLPAELDGVIAVSAVGPQNQQDFDAFALYSNYGRNLVDIAAPGGGIGFDPATFTPVIHTKRDLVLSTWSTQARSYSEGGFDFQAAPHMFLAGTSMATPHVSGVLALMLQSKPRLSGAEARRAVLNSADDLGPRGRDAYYGAGRVNALRAIQ
ncbi:MAG TPA: S8 family serine peptidase [Pantanalinema sp.]